MPEDCPTCNQPIYNVRGAIAEMGKIASERDQLKAEVKRLRKSVAEERERCAKIAEEWGCGEWECANDISEKIRENANG